MLFERSEYPFSVRIFLVGVIVDDIRDDLALIHMIFYAADLLIVLVTLSGEDNDISVLSVFDAVTDRIDAVGDDDIVAVDLVETDLDVRDDIHNVLIAAVVLGDDGQVAELARDLAHFITAGFRTVAARAEHGDQTMGLVFSQGGQDVLHRDRVVRVVDEHGVVAGNRYDLDPAFDLDVRQTAEDILVVDVKVTADRDRRQRVVYGEATRDRNLNIKLLDAGRLKANADKSGFRYQLVAVRDKIRLLTVAVAFDPAGVTLDDRLGVFVVDIDDALLTALEQQTLAGKVFRHILMPM